MVVAVIPARGGSKRIPRKNVRPFAGKPIIAYSIEVAMQTGLFDRIIVSTDSEEIASVAGKYGAEVPFIRPSNLADDFTGTDDVVLHALSWLKKNYGDVDYVCCIYPTAPLLKADYIVRGYNLLLDSGASTVFSVATYPCPIFRSLHINEKNRVEMIWPDNYKKRSQDLPKAYHDAGQFYWADATKFEREKCFFSSDSMPVVIPRHLVQDIDTEEDWVMAERLFNSLK